MHVHYSLSLNLFHIHPSTHQVLLGLPPKYNLNLSPFPSPWPSHRSKSPSSIARTAVKTSPDYFPTSVHITPANRRHVTNSSKSSSSSQDHNVPPCPSVSPHLIPPLLCLLCCSHSGLYVPRPVCTHYHFYQETFRSRQSWSILIPRFNPERPFRCLPWPLIPRHPHLIALLISGQSITHSLKLSCWLNCFLASVCLSDWELHEGRKGSFTFSTEQTHSPRQATLLSTGARVAEHSLGPWCRGPSCCLAVQCWHLILSLTLGPQGGELKKSNGEEFQSTLLIFHLHFHFSR